MDVGTLGSHTKIKIDGVCVFYVVQYEIDPY